MSDPSVIYESAVEGPSTHVFIIGVSRYHFGKGSPRMSSVGGSFRQLTSPGASARAVADWFRDRYRNDRCPLGSISMLLSEDDSEADPKTQADTLEVKKAMRRWASRIGTHPDNLAIFYFCGHGISHGQKAALLLSDFGEPEREYEGAIDLDVLRGTLKNSPASRQLFLLDCCRTSADHLYLNEAGIGTRMLSLVDENPPQHAPRQCVIFASAWNRSAYGMDERPSVFVECLIDALEFAAADDDTGEWIVTTGSLMHALGRLMDHKTVEGSVGHSVPTAVEATHFDLNHLAPPTHAVSIVTLDDPKHWRGSILSCIPTSGGESRTSQANDSHPLYSCAFEVEFGSYEFSAEVVSRKHVVRPAVRSVQRPVVYVRLEVEK